MIARNRLLLFVAFAFASAVAAEERTLRVDAAQSKVSFTLAATAHTVRGTFDVTSGEIRFDPEGGRISGSVVVDVTSADTGNRRRDVTMHADILESAKFPRIVFAPSSFEGRLLAAGESSLTIRGVMTVHGKNHPVVTPAKIGVAGDRVSARASFDVPYVAWGLKDPSAILVRVAKKVRVDVLLHGTLAGN